MFFPSQFLQYWLKERAWKGLNWSYSLQHSSGNETTHSETFNLSLNKIRGTYYGFAWLSLVRGRSLTNNWKSLVEVILIKTNIKYYLLVLVVDLSLKWKRAYTFKLSLSYFDENIIFFNCSTKREWE